MKPNSNNIINQSKQTDSSKELVDEQRFSTIQRTPFYFGKPDKPLMGWVHTAKDVPPQTSCVLICPPLALEYMNSYRSLRHVADYFALAGIPAMRFDYHGTGDSSGTNLDENRMPDWLSSIELAYHHIQKITGINKVGLFGFRMGATFGAITAEKIAYDFMVLWDPIERGKRFVREIKTLQKTSAIAEDDSHTLLEAGGGVYWQATAKAIQSINLTDCKPMASRILVIPGDSLSINRKLLDSYESKGVLTEQLSLEGSSNMLVDAHLTKVPHQSITKMVSWVQTSLTSTQSSKGNSNIYDSEQQATPNLSGIQSEALIKQSCQITYSGNDPESYNKQDFKVNETLIYFGEQHDRFAIETEPVKGRNKQLPIVVISNSGTNHRVGPSRLYVQLARQLAGLGFLVYRIDLPGIGDSIADNRSDENIEYQDMGSQEILAFISKISRQHKGAEFVITGLCSGAYFSFHTAKDSNQQNIAEIIMINPLTFYWEKGMTADSSPARNFSAWNWYKKAILSPTSWKKLFSGNIKYTYLIRIIYQRLKIKIQLLWGSLFAFKFALLKRKANDGTINAIKNDLGLDLESISKTTQLSFLFSRSDPGYDLLTTLGGAKVRRMIKSKKIRIEFVENADHTFSKLVPRQKAIISIIEHLKNRYLP